MSELYTDIQIELGRGNDPRVIATNMDIPLEWVYDVLESTLQSELDEACEMC